MISILFMKQTTHKKSVFIMERDEQYGWIYQSSSKVLL